MGLSPKRSTQLFWRVAFDLALAICLTHGFPTFANERARAICLKGRLQTLHQGRDQYRIRYSADPAFFAEAWVEGKVLRFSIGTKNQEGDRVPGLVGKDQFRKIVRFFQGRFTAIEGHWISGDNLAAFNAQVAEGKSEVEAAGLTWTGRMADEAGCRVPRIIDYRRDRRGVYTRVQVRFECKR